MKNVGLQQAHRFYCAISLLVIQEITLFNKQHSIKLKLNKEIYTIYDF